MDSSSVPRRRTRLQEERYLRREWEKRKGIGITGSTECSSSSVDTLHADRVRVRDSEESATGKVGTSKDDSSNLDSGNTRASKADGSSSGSGKVRASTDDALSLDSGKVRGSKDDSSSLGFGKVRASGSKLDSGTVRGRRDDSSSLNSGKVKASSSKLGSGTVRGRKDDASKFDFGKVRGSNVASNGWKFVAPSNDNDEDDLVVLPNISNSRKPDVVVIDDGDDDEEETGTGEGNRGLGEVKRKVGDAERDGGFHFGKQTAKGDSFKFIEKDKFCVPRTHLNLHSQRKRLVSVDSIETSSESSSSDGSDDNSDDEDFRMNEAQSSDSEEDSTSCGEDGDEDWDEDEDEDDDIVVKKRGSFVVEDEDSSVEKLLKRRRDLGPDKDVVHLEDDDIKTEKTGSIDVDEEEFSVVKGLKRKRDCGDTDDDQVEKGGSFVVEDSSVEEGSKRRRVSRPDILAPPKRAKSSFATSTSYNSVAQRTRSRFNSRLSETKTKKNGGTDSRPTGPTHSRGNSRISETKTKKNGGTDIRPTGPTYSRSNSRFSATKKLESKKQKENDCDDDIEVVDDRNYNDSVDDHIQKEVGGKDEKALVKPMKRKHVQALNFDDDHEDVNDEDNNDIADGSIDKEVGGKDEEELGKPMEHDQALESDSDDDLEVLDDDDLELVDDHDDLELVDDHDDGNNHDNDDVHIQKEVGRKDEEELGKATKRKRVRALQHDSLYKLFVDTIWEKAEVLQKDSTHSDDEAAEDTNPSVAELPLKFSFGVEKPVVKEKSDYEKEMDQLWGEFDFALRSSELGSFGPATVDTEEAEEQEIEADPITLCQLGKHHLILDEQIGIKCGFCSFVKLEIKYILPSFSPSSPWERTSSRRTSDDGDFSIFDAFPFDDNVQGSDVPTTGTVWDKFPGIRKNMYPHQQEGFEFLWRNIAGGIDLDVKSSDCSNAVGGCVISHAPGTGKTFLTIAFLRTYMEIFRECRPVIIAPCNMLLTWEEEFKKWKVDIPFHNLNSGDFSGKEDRQALKLVQNKPQRQNWSRIVKLVSWSRGKSILGVSYQLFLRLAGEPDADKRSKKGRETPCNEGSDEIRKILLQKPSLLVLDEGHTPRNSDSGIFKALSNIKTERRIILSGTPFQNNFEELYNTLWLVRPKFLDRISFKEQGNRGRQSKVVESRGESRAKWGSLTSSIGKNADAKLLEEVRAMIGPFVHVHRGSILQKSLPGLRDCVVVLHAPPLQKQLLKEIQGIKNSFKLEHKEALVSVHPSLLEKCSLSDTEKALIDRNHEITSNRFRLDPKEGVKTRFLMELMKLSEALNERVLVFSQFLDPLFLIKDQLQSLFNWTEGNEVLQMDGKQDPKTRQYLINCFNDPSSTVKVLLASTKACREGINLIGASRIVLLDVVWNPSVEMQAISRAYRLGQKKFVYTYHLITLGTTEGDKYCKQVQKDRLSKLVFSTELGQNENQTNSSTIPEDRILDEMVGHEKLKDMFAKIIYQPKESNLFEAFESVTSKQT